MKKTSHILIAAALAIGGAFFAPSALAQETEPATVAATVSASADEARIASLNASIKSLVDSGDNDRARELIHIVRFLEEISPNQRDEWAVMVANADTSTLYYRQQSSSSRVRILPYIVDRAPDNWRDYKFVSGPSSVTGFSFTTYPVRVLLEIENAYRPTDETGLTDRALSIGGSIFYYGFHNQRDSTYHSYFSPNQILIFHNEPILGFTNRQE